MTALQLQLDFDQSLRDRAEKWMAENPEVMALFERFALEAALKGRKFGIGLLAERVRWTIRYEWSGDLKVNNSYRSFIARALIAKHPHLSELIETRRTKDEQ